MRALTHRERLRGSSNSCRENAHVSESTLRHIYEEHEDLIETLKLKSLTELREVIMSVLRDPHEVYADTRRDDVRYYLRKINDLWINVIVVSGTVRTAYLIGLKSYKRLKEKRWR